MSKERVEVMIEGGHAVAGATLGQALGPLKVNISDVLTKINTKTVDFKGMKVPVTVIVDTKTKEVELVVGTPPTSELIKKELAIAKGSGKPNLDKVGNMAIEQVIKVAKMKRDSMHVNTLKAAVKSVIGSASIMGVLVEGKDAKEINVDINLGKYDSLIDGGVTEVSLEKKAQLSSQLKEIQDKIKKELEKIAKEQEAAKAAEGVVEEKVVGEEKAPGEGAKAPVGKEAAPAKGAEAPKAATPGKEAKAPEKKK
mgnify:CR=1 FL=1